MTGKLNLQVFPIDNSPGFLINRLTRELNNFLNHSFSTAGFNITVPQWAVLNRLWEEEGLHQSELAARIVRDRHNLARIIAGMERNGLIRRESDSEDRRLQRVFLTPTGRELKDRLVPVAAKAARKAFAGLEQEDIALLRKIYKLVMQNIEPDL